MVSVRSSRRTSERPVRCRRLRPTRRRGVGPAALLRERRRRLNEYLGAQPVFPYQRDQYRPFFEAYSGLGDRCLDGSDPVAPHMSTANVARDMDLLRQAVGDAQAHLPRVLVRLVPRQHVRQHVPQERAGARDRRSPRPAPVVDRLPDRLRPGGDRRRSSVSSCACATRPARTARSPRRRAHGRGGRPWRRRSGPSRSISATGVIYTYDFLIADARIRDVRAGDLGRSGRLRRVLRLPGRRGAGRPGRGGERPTRAGIPDRSVEAGTARRARLRQRSRRLLRQPVRRHAVPPLARRRSC